MHFTAFARLRSRSAKAQLALTARLASALRMGGFAAGSYRMTVQVGGSDSSIRQELTTTVWLALAQLAGVADERNTRRPAPALHRPGCAPHRDFFDWRT